MKSKKRAILLVLVLALLVTGISACERSYTRHMGLPDPPEIEYEVHPAIDLFYEDIEVGSRAYELPDGGAILVWTHTVYVCSDTTLSNCFTYEPGDDDFSAYATADFLTIEWGNNNKVVIAKDETAIYTGSRSGVGNEGLALSIEKVTYD